MSKISFPWALVVSSQGSAKERKPIPPFPSTVTISAGSAALRPNLVKSATISTFPGWRYSRHSFQPARSCVARAAKVRLRN
ncbi:hypothetical protein ABIE18_004263 [Arthrobacter sp. 2762]